MRRRATAHQHVPIPLLAGADILMARQLMFVMVAVLATIPGSGEILDRIAVTVGRHVISERDILQDIRISAFIDSKPAEITGDQKRKAADRLIDQYLLLEDAAS